MTFWERQNYRNRNKTGELSFIKSVVSGGWGWEEGLTCQECEGIFKGMEMSCVLTVMVI